MRVRLHPRSGVRSVRLPDGTVLTPGVVVDVTPAVFATHGRRRNGRPLLQDVTPPKPKPRPKPKPKPQPATPADNAEPDPSQEDN